MARRLQEELDRESFFMQVQLGMLGSHNVVFMGPPEFSPVADMAVPVNMPLRILPPAMHIHGHHRRGSSALRASIHHLPASIRINGTRVSGTALELMSRFSPCSQL